MTDEIINEIRSYREEIAKEEGYDMHKIFLSARERQATRKTVNLKEGNERPAYPKPQQVAEPETPYGQ